MGKIINSDIRNFVNVTAHPTGCENNVRSQVEEAEANGPGTGIGNVLVIGSSAGYGLASLVTAVFGYGADGLGICFERPIKGKRTAAPGAYNVAALHKIALEKGRHIETINLDAFSRAAKAEAAAVLRDRYGKLDYLFYSLASSRRADADTGALYHSRIKPIGSACTTQTIDPESETLRQITVEPATETEIGETVKVMGGEDLKLWVESLSAAGLLNPGCRIIAYTYVGSEATASIYRSGTIGAAKMDLERSALEVDRFLEEKHSGNCWIVSCQAQVTRASSVIPAMPLYISLLKKAMGTRYESAIGQITRLFARHIEPGRLPLTDDENRIRLDDRELAAPVQDYVLRTWEKLTDANFRELADWEGFKSDFIRTAGFGLPGIDYSDEVDTEVKWLQEYGTQAESAIGASADARP
jgi:enoyl-[acyl-carrier protein] reductase / trans-2-enoyl-CoA reductase (NAD+)